VTPAPAVPGAPLTPCHPRTRDHSTPVTAVAGATTSGEDAVLTKAGHITGTVRYGSTAIAGLSVQAYRADNSWAWSTTTGADGKCDLEGLATGSYRVQSSSSLPLVVAPAEAHWPGPA
jgi:hypothetical protein